MLRRLRFHLSQEPCCFISMARRERFVRRINHRWYALVVPRSFIRVRHLILLRLVGRSLTLENNVRKESKNVAAIAEGRCTSCECSIRKRGYKPQEPRLTTRSPYYQYIARCVPTPQA